MRFRAATADERAWMRSVVREHCAEHFPDVRRPGQTLSERRSSRVREQLQARPVRAAGWTKRAVAGLRTNSSVSPHSPRTCRWRPSSDTATTVAGSIATAEMGDTRARRRGRRVGRAGSEGPGRLHAMVQAMQGRSERGARPDRAPTAAAAGTRYGAGIMRRTKIVATIGPASREPDDAAGDGAGRDGRRAAELLARHARGARRDGTARARRGRAGGAAGGDPAGPARAEAADRSAARGRRRADGRRAADDHRRRDRGARRRPTHEHHLGWARRLDDVGGRAVSRRRVGAAARRGGPRGRARGRRRDRGRRRGRLAPGAEHPRSHRRRCHRCPRRTWSCCATASRSAWTWSRCRSCTAPRTSRRYANTRACR